jgi:hypothetical protein
MTAASWRPTRGAGLLAAISTNYDLVGFTTFTMSDGVRRFRMSRRLTEAEPSAMPKPFSLG